MKAFKQSETVASSCFDPKPVVCISISEEGFMAFLCDGQFKDFQINVKPAISKFKYRFKCPLNFQHPKTHTKMNKQKNKTKNPIEIQYSIE